MKSNRISPLLVGLTLLLLIFIIGCGQSQSEIYQEDNEAGLNQSGVEIVPVPSTEPDKPTSTPQSELEKDYQQRFEQGNAYLEQEQWYEAVAEYTKAIELSPEFAEAYAYRALARFRQLEYNLAAGNEYSFVITDCEKAAELNPLVKLDIALAEAYVRRGDYYFEHALSESDYNKAIADYTAAMKLDPLIKVRTPADVYYERGEQHLENQNYDHAIADFTKAMQLDPHMNLDSRLAEAYHGRGMNHYEYSTDREKAIADYTKAIELDPTNANYYLSRAFVYDEWAYYYYDHGRSSEQMDSNNKAIADYTKVIELKPGVGNFYYFRGRCYADNGDYARAVADYSRAIGLGELGDLIANVYWGRASAHENLGNNEKALTDYRKALELSEDDWTKEQILKDIEKLEAKYVIKDLAYIRIFAAGYSDDADPETDGISLRITFYDSKSESITFQGILVTVTIELYGYTGQWGSLGGGDRELVHQEQTTLDYSKGFFGTQIKIPYENIEVDQNRYYEYGAVEVTVATPKQGNFQTMQGLVRLYP